MPSKKGEKLITLVQWAFMNPIQNQVTTMKSTFLPIVGTTTEALNNADKIVFKHQNI